MFPALIPSKLVLYGALAAALFVTGFVAGLRLEGQRHAEYIAEQARQAVAVVVRQGKVTERVLTRYLKVKGDTQVVTVTVEKEVQNYANAGSCLDDSWVRLHDAAAANALPRSAERANDPMRAATAGAWRDDGS